MAYASCGHREDALDMVQDAMLKFAAKYANRPPEEWKPLFYRILHNRITDNHRRRAVRNAVSGFLGRTRDDHDADAAEDPFQTVPDRDGRTPEQAAQVGGAFAALQAALRELPVRQRQVFMLRVWEELSVKETAAAMNCSEGSVKTHFSRAVQALRNRLGDHWP
jgi:RNA polymerase sigma-70 factor (ECF subfamily)